MSSLECQIVCLINSGDQKVLAVILGKKEFSIKLITYFPVTKNKIYKISPTFVEKKEINIFNKPMYFYKHISTAYFFFLDFFENKVVFTIKNTFFLVV